MTYNEELVARIERIVSYYQVSGRAFASACGVPITTMNSVLNKRSSPRAETLYNIIEAYPEVDPTWLLTGRGEMLVTENTATSMEIISTYSSTIKEKIKLEKKIDEQKQRIDMLTDTIQNLSEALNAERV